MAMKGKGIESPEAAKKRMTRKDVLKRQSKFVERQKKIESTRKPDHMGEIDLGEFADDLGEELEALKTETLKQQPLNIFELEVIIGDKKNHISELEKLVSGALENLKPKKMGGQGAKINAVHLLKIGNHLHEIDKRSLELNELIEKIEKAKLTQIEDYTDISTAYGEIYPTGLEFDEELDDEGPEEKMEEESLSIHDYLKPKLLDQEELTVQVLAQAYEDKWQAEFAQSVKDRKKKEKKEEE